MKDMVEVLGINREEAVEAKKYWDELLKNDPEEYERQQEESRMQIIQWIKKGRKKA